MAFFVVVFLNFILPTNRHKEIPERDRETEKETETDRQIDRQTDIYGFDQQKLIWYVCRLWDMVFS